MKPKRSPEQIKVRSARNISVKPPICHCCNKPMRWNQRSDLLDGGYWRCSEKYKPAQKRWREANKQARAIYMANWRRRNPRHRSAYMRFYRYGISKETYEQLYRQQQGKCILCDVHADAAPRKTLTVDHDHQTGKIRGLLCVTCNSALERLEQAGWTERAVAYLGIQVSL